MNLILFILACYGITQIIVYGKIFAKIRKKINNEFLECPMCIGFHVGYIVYVLFYFSGISLFPNLWIGIFIFASISSATSCFLCNLITDEGINFKVWKDNE